MVVTEQGFDANSLDTIDANCGVYQLQPEVFQDAVQMECTVASKDHQKLAHFVNEFCRTRDVSSFGSL